MNILANYLENKTEKFGIQNYTIIWACQDKNIATIIVDYLELSLIFW